MKLVIIEANQKFIESAGSVIKVFINKIGVFFYFKKNAYLTDSKEEILTDKLWIYIPEHT